MKCAIPPTDKPPTDMPPPSRRAWRQQVPWPLGPNLTFSFLRLPFLFFIPSSVFILSFLGRAVKTGGLMESCLRRRCHCRCHGGPLADPPVWLTPPPQCHRAAFTLTSALVLPCSPHVIAATLVWWGCLCLPPPKTGCSFICCVAC